MSVIGRTAPWLTGVSTFNFAISSNQANANLRTLAIAAGWDTLSKVTATINSGVTVYGSGAVALTINGSFPNGVALINNGNIYGYRGFGGNGGSTNGITPASAGTNGLTALSVSVATEITNNGAIAGGGGGGGGGGRGRNFDASVSYGGGGGGNGQDFFGAATVGANGEDPGSAGSSYGEGTEYGKGGTGGAFGTAGNRGYDGHNGIAGNNLEAGAAGGNPGNSVLGNSNITWISTGTRLGPIS